MSSFDRLMEMAQAKNPVAYPLTPMSVSLANIVAGGVTPETTHLTIRAHPNSRYLGEVGVTYLRSDLAVLGEVGVSKETAFAVVDVLNKVNQLKGTSLALDDAAIPLLASMETGVVTVVTLEALPDSLTWMGHVEVALLTGIPEKSNELYTFLTTQAAPLFVS